MIWYDIYIYIYIFPQTTMLDHFTTYLDDKHI